MKVAVETREIVRGSAEYGANVAQLLGEDAPASITVAGESAALAGKSLALFCSVSCPGNLILQTYDLAVALREAGVAVVSGFHSPMEQECLTLLLRGRQPVIVCPARGIEGMRVPAAWKEPMTHGRLVVVSPFAGSERRVTAERALRRNRFVAALADAVFVAHSAAGGQTEALCREVVTWGKPLLTFGSEQNAGIMALGARGVSAQAMGAWWPVG